METKEIDIRILLADILASNSKTYRHIDKIYNKNKALFLQLMQENTDIKDSILVKEGSLEREIYFLKIYSILKSENDEYSEDIFNILKNTYKFIYNYLISKKKLVLSDFGRYICSKHDSKLLDEIMDLSLVAISLAQWLYIEVDLEDDLYKRFISEFKYTLNNYNSGVRIKFKDLNKEEKDLVKKVYKNLKTNYIKNPNITPTMHEPSPGAEDKETGCFINERFTDLDRFLLPFYFIHENEDFNVAKVTNNIKVTENDILDLILTYMHMGVVSEPEKVDYKDLYKYVIVGIRELFLIREYKRAKDVALKNLELDTLDIVNEKEAEIRDLKKKILQLQDENENLKNEVELSNKKIANLTSEISERDGSRQELNELRSYIFNLDSEDNIEDDKALDELKDINAVCFGGRPNWIVRMKEKVNWNFVSADTLNFDINLIKNAEYVFINASYISHGMYYKIMENISLNNKLKYINNRNINRCLNEIRESIG